VEVISSIRACCQPDAKGGIIINVIFFYDQGRILIAQISQVGFNPAAGIAPGLVKVGSIDW